MPIVKTPTPWPAVLRSRNIRLWSGIVLGFYLLDHFLNVALGLVSVDAMERAAPVLSAPCDLTPVFHPAITRVRR